MHGKKNKIIIVDDHPAILDGIRSALESEPDFQIAGTAGDGFKAIELVNSLKPDIVIMDYSMPNMDGLEATEKIKKISGNTRIIIYSMISEKDLISSLFRSGISGFVLKGQPMSELVMALRSVAMGGVFFSDVIGMTLQEFMAGNMARDQEEDILSRLSKREKEIFILLADGQPINKIADQLFISPKTVETHKYNIMEKLGLKSPAQLTKIALRKKLIKI